MMFPDHAASVAAAKAAQVAAQCAAGRHGASNCGHKAGSGKGAK